MSDVDRCWPVAPDGWMVTDRSGEPARVAAAQVAPAVVPVALGALTDGELVEAARAGRVEAFDLLVHRHQRTVYRVCYRFAGRHEDASDLTQDVFLRAYRALGSYRGQASFRTWIYRIAVNVGLSRVTAPAPPMEELEPVHAITDGAHVDEDLDRDRRAVRVRDAVSRLPPKQRAAIVLRVFQDLSHEEAARVLGCTVGTVKANVFHAMRKLRSLLGEP